VHISKDVIFYEDATWSWSGDQAARLDFNLSFDDETDKFQTIETEVRIDPTPYVGVTTVQGSGGVPHKMVNKVVKIKQLPEGGHHHSLRLQVSSVHHPPAPWMQIMMMHLSGTET
jgi:hypothetical protein